jgi:septin family protein
MMELSDLFEIIQLGSSKNWESEKGLRTPDTRIHIFLYFIHTISITNGHR